jgi:hypothetical protein
MRPHQHRPHPAKQDSASDGGNLRFAHPVAQRRERVGAHLVRGQVVGLVEVDVVDVRARDESLDLQGFSAFQDGCRDGFRIDDDLLAVFDFEALGLRLFRDQILSLAVDEDAIDLVAGGLVDCVERDTVARRYSGIERDVERNLAEF